MWKAAAPCCLMLMAVAGCGLSLPGAIDHAMPVATASDLQLLGTQALSPRLSELTFRTEYLDDDTRVRVLLPKGYDGGTQRYPVLYLLNGALDDQSSWTDPPAKGDAEIMTADLPLIVVMPDGGVDGDYSDYYNFGAYGNQRWESYHIGQLVPWIDAHYRTTGTRGGRGIAGLSMGGGGATKYAARHPQLFGVVASFSGDDDSNYPPVVGTPDLPTSGRESYAVWGLRATDEVRWRGNNAWDLAENLRGMGIFIRSHNGNTGGGEVGDPIEAGAYTQSLHLHQALDALAIPNQWNDDGPGGHQWPHWNADLLAILPAVMDFYAHPVASPSPFDFRAIENDYAPYGWQVHLERAVLEFSELSGADASGFTLSGSGDAAVTTAALYAPGQTMHVTRTTGAGSDALDLNADDQGRLTVPVPLGPVNKYQQYTEQARLAGTAVYATRVDIAPR